MVGPRLEKLRGLLAWPEAMAQLRVCFLLDVPALDRVIAGFLNQ